MTDDIVHIIEQVCVETHFPMIHSVFGDKGVNAAFDVMRVAKELFKHVELERVEGHVVIFRRLSTHNGPGSLGGKGRPVDFAGLANTTISDLILEILEDDQVVCRPSDGLDIASLASGAVVYSWHGGNEEFLAGSLRKAVFRLDPAARSQFAVPTLADLRGALGRYAAENVRESTCYIFNGVWFDENRLFLKAKPERTMRNSLVQFLRNRIGATHDVFPEQNVDESHPVDLRVQPRLQNNRLMLIEIKWLGLSVGEDGHVTARHAEARAQSGADQLAEYLDAQRRFAPSRVIHGYYVIIDGRRRNLQEGATEIARVDGMYYEARDLTFDPSHHTRRVDFDPPYRMFARPCCAD